jgi:hypothetical protein
MIWTLTYPLIFSDGVIRRPFWTSVHRTTTMYRTQESRLSFTPSFPHSHPLIIDHAIASLHLLWITCQEGKGSEGFFRSIAPFDRTIDTSIRSDTLSDKSNASVARSTAPDVRSFAPNDWNTAPDERSIAPDDRTAANSLRSNTSDLRGAAFAA